MKLKQYLCATLLALSFPALAWSPAGDAIKTRWADSVDVNKVWDKYPRPLLKRNEWKNLNGLWNYAITPAKSHSPKEFQGEILVPFAVESSLSGVGRRVKPDEALWYSRSFIIPKKWNGQDIMLNFGAVDWACEVWVNGINVGAHKGGYSPFSINITPALNRSGENSLLVKVIDPTDNGYQPRGKQVNKPNGIWYTPVTGIWQTVWLEPVAKNHISDLRITPDVDSRTLTVNVSTPQPDNTSAVEIKIKDQQGNTIASGKSINNRPVNIEMPENVQLWSPDTPAIYDMEVSLYDANNKLVDRVESYTALRKLSTRPDKNGVMRLCLNDKPIFHFGPLDQGWWPDGLYTAPTYEAMIYDIDKTMDWGFNMIRKHVKVEPQLWYEYCDRNGILVWQDMPNGDRGPEWQMHNYFNGAERERSAQSEENYRREWKEIIDAFYNHPSIVTWVPFNEAWGQFKCPEIAQWTKDYDPTRLVNPASGGNHYHVGDMLDIHHYPGPEIKMIAGERPTVLGEYGGIGLVEKDHIWSRDRNWGYTQFNNSNEVTDQYVKYIDQLLNMVPTCYSGAVYTQTTDVENEVNGLMTYDREVIKIDEDRVREANKKLTESLK